MVRLVLATAIWLWPCLILACDNPTEWTPYIPPRTAYDKYERKRYRCDGELADLKIKVGKSLNIRPHRALLVYGKQPFKAEPGTGYADKISGTMSLEQLYEHFKNKNATIKTSTDTAIFVVDALQFEGQSPKLKYDKPFVRYEDDNFHILFYENGDVPVTEYIELGTHNICKDGVSGPVVNRQMPRTGTSYSFGPTTLVYHLTTKKFVPSWLAIANGIWNAVQQYQIQTLIAAGLKQTLLNDLLIYKETVAQAISNLRVYNTRVMISATHFTSTERDQTLLNYRHLDAATRDTKSGNDIDKILNITNDVLDQLESLRIGHQNVAKSMEATSPYVALSIYMGVKCPPYEARYSISLRVLEVRQCSYLQCRKIIPEGYPTTQHLNCSGSIYHADGCQYVAGYAVSTNMLDIREISENETHYNAVTSGKYYILSKTTKMVSFTETGVYGGLPKDNIQDGIDTRDAYNTKQLDLAAEAIGLNRELKDLYNTASLSGLALPGLGALLSGGLFSLCCGCCPPVCQMCCLKCPWLLDQSIVLIQIVLYRLIGHVVVFVNKKVNTFCGLLLRLRSFILYLLWAAPSVSLSKA